jgi:hypothetical protein
VHTTFFPFYVISFCPSLNSVFPFPIYSMHSPSFSPQGSNLVFPLNICNLLRFPSSTYTLTVLKKSLAAANLSNIRILDTCCASGCAPTDNITVRLDKIREVMSSDGVHFSQLGYKNITSACIGGAAILHNRKVDNPSGYTVRGRVFYWRGFRSPVGAVTCLDMRTRG